MGRYTGKSCRLVSMLVLTSSFFLVEIIVGYATNSIALVADSFHMLSDVVALTVGLASVRISRWESSQNTYGWVRAEVLGALVNAVFLVALCFSITVESLKRLVSVEEIKNSLLMLIVGGIGLLVNICGLFLFMKHGHSHGGHSHGGDKPTLEDAEDEIEKPFINSVEVVDGEVAKSLDKENVVVMVEQNAKPKISTSEQLNMRGVFLHVFGDALGSVIVIISSLVIMFAKGSWRFYIDPALSLLLVAIIMTSTIPLLKESALILLQTVPTHINIPDIRSKLEKLNGINAIHEFHVWQLAGHRIIASAHIHCQNIQEYMVLASEVKRIFHSAGIHSSTVQPEFVQMNEIALQNCALECGPDMTCHPKTCCVKRPPKVKSKLKDVSNDSDSKMELEASSNLTFSQVQNISQNASTSEDVSDKNMTIEMSEA